MTSQENNLKEIDCSGWLIFDLENNMLPESSVRGSFYRRASKMLCVVTKEVVTGEVKVFKEGEERSLMEHLLSSPRLIAHNGRGYDIPALGNIYPEFNKVLRAHPLIDTLIQSRKDFPNKKLSEFDTKRGFPTTKALHSLKSWGYRFNSNKLEEFVDVDWENQPCTEELVDYCKQDVVVTELLFHHLLKNKGLKVKHGEK